METDKYRDTDINKHREGHGGRETVTGSKHKGKQRDTDMKTETEMLRDTQRHGAEGGRDREVERDKGIQGEKNRLRKRGGRNKNEPRGF